MQPAREYTRPALIPAFISAAALFMEADSESARETGILGDPDTRKIAADRN